MLLTLTEEEIVLIEDSWRFAAQSSSGFGLTFYNELFTLDPSLRSIFKEDITLQVDKFVTIIRYVISHLKNENLLSELRQLGSRHRSYNVRPGHYAVVGVALLKTFENMIGSEWKPEARTAWMKLYSQISEIMLTA
jgi:hemoglobin-like flavoprotein